METFNKTLFPLTDLILCEMKENLFITDRMLLSIRIITVYIYMYIYLQFMIYEHHAAFLSVV